MKGVFRTFVTALALWMILGTSSLTFATVFIKPIRPVKPPVKPPIQLPKSTSKPPGSRSPTAAASHWLGYSVEGIGKKQRIANQVEITPAGNGSLKITITTREGNIIEHVVPSVNLPAPPKGKATWKSKSGVEVAGKDFRKISDRIVCDQSGCNQKNTEAEVHRSEPDNPHVPHPPHEGKDEKHDKSCEGREFTTEKCDKY